MKIGIRKPSIKKSIKARTTGRAKRAVKKAVIPGYGKKGTGMIKNPKKAMYNKVYNKTTVSVASLASPTKKKNAPTKRTISPQLSPSYTSHTVYEEVEKEVPKFKWLRTLGFWTVGIGIISISAPLLISAAALFVLWQMNKNKLTKKTFKAVKKTYSAEEVAMITMEYENAMRIYEDSLSLIENTVKPDVFFNRYDLTLRELETLLNLAENTGDLLPIDLKKLRETYQNLIEVEQVLFLTFSNKYLEAATEKALKLKTVRGRTNNLEKSYDAFKVFSDRYSSEDREKIEIEWQSTFNKLNEPFPEVEMT